MMQSKKHVHWLALFQTRIIVTTLNLFFILTFASPQKYVDSLQQELSKAKNDIEKILTLGSLADYWGFIQFDSSIFYARQTLELSQKVNYPYGKYLSYYSLFHAMNCKGDYPKALEVAQNILPIAEQLKYKKPWVLPETHYFLGLLNREVADYPGAINQFQQVLELEDKTRETGAEMKYFAYSQLALVYANLKKLDSALLYAQMGYEKVPQLTRYKKYVALIVAVLGNMYERKGNYKQAEAYFKIAVQLSDRYNNLYFKARNYNNLAALFNKMNNADSSIYYARLSLSLCLDHEFAEFTRDASLILSQVYQSNHQPDSALKYLRLMVAANDSVFSQAKGQQYQHYIFKDAQRQQEINAAKERYQYRVKMYALLAALSVFLLLAFILYRSNRQKQKDKFKIEQAYQDLKTTQAQLIQSEKLASLGEVTAGIAHEIQNPLNFVNNFSETNVELLQELKEELHKGNMQEANAIASGIIDNEQKVVHHGKRAEAIVKRMLLHSRNAKGEKQLTDINALIDEYLLLAYHSFRAKDNSFIAKTETHFDEKVGKISIIPQEIGRVLLNLFNNAMYATAERKIKGSDSYVPTIVVTTQKLKDKIKITVKDNGMGILKSLQDKIFQPFFTTKPTTEGSGLGLSLSYDIIKAHGGELKVDSTENEGAQFIIQLPSGS